MPTYTGTTSADTLAGSLGADTLIGLTGNDTYVVNNLLDEIVETPTGGGIDTIETNVLDDLGQYSLAWWANVERLVWTGMGAAQLAGNALNNLIRANQSYATSDTLSGGAGNDSLYGFGGNDSLFGGEGDDWLDGGSGNDFMLGGAGNDRYVISSLDDRVYESSNGGIDTLQSAVMTDLRVIWAQQIESLLYTGSQGRALHGNALDNQLESRSAAADTVYGYAGNDTLIGGAGADLLVGGTGDDLYRGVDALDQVMENVFEGVDTIEGSITSLATGALATTVEALFYTGTSGASLLGNGLDNLLHGHAGADSLTGFEGRDSLFGGAGADVLAGGAGDDVLYGGGLTGLSIGTPWVPDAAVDTLIGGAGNDRYFIDSSRDVILEEAVDGGFDVVMSSVDNSLTRYASVEALLLQAGSGAWMARGAGGAETLVGNEADNYLIGGDGADTLCGFVAAGVLPVAQNDVLDGGTGADVLISYDFGFAGAGLEATLFGGGGNDTYILGGAGSYSGLDSGGTDVVILMTSGSVEALAGVENIYLSGAQPDKDAMARQVLSGLVSLVTPGAAFAVDAGAALDAYGNDAANRMFGNALNNRLEGGDGNDTLSGGAGKDTLVGGGGVDSLIGGIGDDAYFMDAGDAVVEAAGGGFDVIHSATISSLAAYGNVEGLHYLGSTAVLLSRGAGNTSADLFSGGMGNDTLEGYGGNDSLAGGAGDDLILGGVGIDQLWGDGGGDDLQGGDGADVLNGGSGADTLAGGSGADSLRGGAGDDVLYAGLAEATGLPGDLLWGDDPDDPLSAGHDAYRFETLTSTNSVSETFAGSGVFQFRAGSTIKDFEVGMDRIELAAYLLGDGDLVLDGVGEKLMTDSSFSSSAELVFFRTDLPTRFMDADDLCFAPVAAGEVQSVMGTADAALALGETRLYVLDDGFNSALFLFQSTDGNAIVTVDEVYLIGVVQGQSALSAADFGLL